MKIKNLILGVCFLLGGALYAQKDCKCYENTYTVIGDLSFSSTVGQQKTDYYAGVADGKVQFTRLTYNLKGELQVVQIQTMPVKDINLQINDMFGSKSTSENKEEGGQKCIELTLGGALFSDATSARFTTDYCIGNGTNPNTSKTVTSSGIVFSKFTSGTEVLKLTDAVKAAQGN
jgi:hypothetical protein